MKVIIDAKEKTFKIIGWVTIPELTEFVDKHGFGEYIMKFEDSDVHDADKVITNDDELPNGPVRRTEYRGGELLTFSNGEEIAIAKL